jgi:hypothetical protein
VYLERLLDFAKLPRNRDGLFEIIKMYNKMLSLAVSGMDSNFVQTIIHDQATSTHFLNNYVGGKSFIYSLAHNFGKHLDKVDLDIDCKYLSLTAGESYLIEFPFDYAAKDGISKHSSAIVSVGISDRLTEKFISPTSAPELFEKEKNSDSDLAVTFICPDFVNNQYKGVSSYFCSPIPKQGKISSLIEGASGKEEIDPKFIQMIFKTLLYLKSGEPDLKSLNGSQCFSSKKSKIRNHLRQHCPFDTISVGYAFHGKTYTVGEVPVSGHFRWQRYAPGFSKIKLIWIEEHLRRYNLSSSSEQLT